MLTDKQKQIYNLYQSTSRGAFDQPYRYRKDFDSFEDSHKDVVISLQKIESLLSKYKHINVKMFFEAPYKLVKLSKPLGLEYYHSLKSIKIYHTYAKELDSLEPDSPEQLQFCINSLKFIRTFCEENSISITDYPVHKKSLTYSWCKHLLENNISFYSVVGFNYLGYNIFTLLNNIPSDEKELFFDNFDGKLNEYYNKLVSSKQCNLLLKKGYEILKSI